MNIALMSHDNKKELMVQFCTAYAGILSHHNIYATNTTGHMVADATGLNTPTAAASRSAPGSHTTNSTWYSSSTTPTTRLWWEMFPISPGCATRTTSPLPAIWPRRRRWYWVWPGAIWTGAASSIPPTVPSLDIFPQSAYNHPVDSFAPRGCRSSTPIAGPTERGAPLRAARPAWTKDSGGAGAETPTAPSP